MRFFADLHIHSHYSIATSKTLTPEHLDYWARVKGLTVVGSGDFTHPGWLAELKEKLEPAEPGLFKLKDELRLPIPFLSKRAAQAEVRFMLTAEISNIYKKFERVRKVHNVIFAPDFETVEKIQRSLAAIGNITSDGRPILGLDSRDLLEIALNANPDIFFLPAHVWTPWFSALGAKSGFDSIEQCYGDLAGHIFAVETGLSTDPPMNWMCSFLDRYTLMSNSDAHSPEKLGRNANIFDCTLSYYHMLAAIKESGSNRFAGTIDLYPQEGKYHYDGHRKCGIRWNPVETLQHRGLCPICGKKVTVGVMNRIVQLGDRQKILERPKRKAYFSIIPLKEILSEILGSGVNSKAVSRRYQQLLQNIGTEFDILLNLPLDELSLKTDALLSEAIRRMRKGQVVIKEGFDGEYGQIHVFDEQERSRSLAQKALFMPRVAESDAEYKTRPLLNFSLEEYQRLQQETGGLPADEKEESAALRHLNTQQQAAVRHKEGAALVIAGPGTGKTQVLTQRIVYLLQALKVPAEHILAVTFTNQAADEMRRRLKEMLKDERQAESLTVRTFHALGLDILKRLPEYGGHLLLDDEDRTYILRDYAGVPKNEIARAAAAITHFKERLLPAERAGEEATADYFRRYQQALAEFKALDLQDLLYRSVLTLERDTAVLQDLRRQFRWILIDEYQDVNFAQYRLLQLLAGAKGEGLFVIGDPNQAIYGFRGADVTYIQRFKEDFPDAHIYRLNKSYRCSQKILNASANVLSGDGSALEGVTQGLKIRIVSEASDKSEAEFVARTIEKMLGGVHFFSMDSGISAGNKKSGIDSLSDFAVLCRTAKQMPAIEKALNDHRLPYQKVSGEALFRKRGLRLLLQFLKLGAFPGNAYLIQSIETLSGLPETHIERLQSTLQKEPLVAGKIRLLLQRLPEHTQPDRLTQNLLIEKSKPYKNNLNGFLQFAVLGSDVDLFEYNVEKISLLTLHASKGLEFKCVFITGCEEGLLPYSLFNHHSDKKEEERLLYVGMTRASKYLYLSHARRRFLMGRELQAQRSPFLERIEQELLELQQTTRKKRGRGDANQLSLFD